MAVWIWTAAGFALGTAVATPLILSVDFQDQVAGGAIYGGIIGALVGYLNGRQRAGK